MLLCKYQKEKESSAMSFLDELNEISKTPEEAAAEKYQDDYQYGMKYDKIVEISKERSRQNTETAIRAIEEMLREGEWITVAQLAKKTKLSRANFYVNKDIRKSLDDARYRQQRMLKINFDSVMEIEDLQEKLRKLNLEMVKLRAENQELQVINRNLQKEI